MIFMREAMQRRLLKDRVYDLIITSYKIKENHISSVPFLKDQVLLSVPDDSSLLGYDAISLKDIPAQPLLYPQIGGYFSIADRETDY